MKTPLVIALSIVGVLGTAGAAMAVNAGTLASFQQSNLGNAPTTLVDPTSTPTPSITHTPEPSETAEPGDDNGTEHSGTSGNDDATEHNSPSPSPTHHDDGGSDDGSHSGGDDGGSGGHGSDD